MRTAILLLLVLDARLWGAGAVPPVYPGKHWQTESPAKSGLDEAKLHEIAAMARGSGCIVRYGAMVYQWGQADRRRDVASAAKPIYSHFLLKAVEDGLLTDLDQPVCEWEPKLRGLNPNLNYKDRRITWRHLAFQTACYGLTNEPGTAFAYNDWQMALFWDLLFEKVYGADFDTVDTEVLHPKLTDILQCEDRPSFLAFGAGDRPGRTAISPRDFARFGLLYLRGGKWHDKQLIRAASARMAVTSPLPLSLPQTQADAAEMLAGQRSIGSRRVPDNQCDHAGSYSWLWWINGIDREGRYRWSDSVPPDTYGCFGHGGVRAMVVIPSLDLIISWNDTQIEGTGKEGQVLGLLVQAVTKPSDRVRN